MTTRCGRICIMLGIPLLWILQVDCWTTVGRRAVLQAAQSLLLSPSIDTSMKPESKQGKPSVPAMPSAQITDRIFMDIRIARQDGSTYVRDDLPDTFENQVIYIRLKLGLYGKTAPNHVEKFLSYVVPANDNDVDNPFPSYGRSNFPSLNQETGLLKGGYIPSLRTRDVSGTTAITYGSRILPAKLWIEPNSAASVRIPHSTKGLLTHKNLDPTPNFGITTRASPQLDGTDTVFGQVLWDDETVEWFRKLEDLPTYAMNRPSNYDDFNSGGAATIVFNAQRDLFRGAAQSLGDTRIDRLYEGKLLRRIEVTQVGRL